MYEMRMNERFHFSSFIVFCLCTVCFLETLRVYERFTIRGVANHGQLRRLTIEETMISRVNPVSRYNAPMIAVSR